VAIGTDGPLTDDAAAVPPPTGHVGLSSTGVFLSSVAIQAIGVVASTVLNHFVATGDSGKAIIGTIQLYLLIASSINGLADLRIGTAYTFFIARGADPRAATATYLALRLAMVAVTGVGLFVLGTLPGTGFTWAATPEDVGALAIFMALPVLWSIQTVYTQLVVAQGRSTAGQIPLLLESVIRTPLLVLVAFELPTVQGLTYAYIPGAVASAVYALPAVLRQLDRVRRVEAVQMFRYAWPLMASLLLLYIVNNAPTFFVVAYQGNIALAEFSAANGWRILALSLPAAVTVPLFPHIVALHRSQGLAAARASAWKALRYTAMLVVPGVTALIVYRVNLLNIFANATFVGPASLPLAILAASVVPTALSQIIGTSLNAVGYQRLELYLTTAQLIALFASLIVLLRPFELFGFPGLVAIAVAIFVSSGVAFALNTYYLLRVLDVRLDPVAIARILGAGIVAFYAVSRLNTVLAVSRYYEFALAVVLGFGVYFVVLALIGELRRDDVHYLVGAVGLPARVGHALARLCWPDPPAPR